MRPTEKVLSECVSPIRAFQNRIISGRPSRSRGPGNNSRKKSASWASKDRKPFGTIVMGRAPEVGVVTLVEDARERLDEIAVDSSVKSGAIEGEPGPFALEC